MAYGGECVFHPALFVWRYREALKERCNVRVGDEALRVWYALVVQDHADFQGIG